jgi:outer membrane protein OmpA-like peptidoglycan-associated protein
LSQGLAPNKLTSEGKGQSQPVADNETEEGRAKNRRVELHVNR